MTEAAVSDFVTIETSSHDLKINGDLQDSQNRTLDENFEDSTDYKVVVSEQPASQSTAPKTVSDDNTIQTTIEIKSNDTAYDNDNIYNLQDGQPKFPTSTKDEASTSWASRLKGNDYVQANSTNDHYWKTHSSFTGNNSLNVSSKEPDSEFDSALFAGMRDTRERIALLRLESVIVDFMNSDAGWLEVGGPYNSFVLSSSGVSNDPRTLVSTSFVNGAGPISTITPSVNYAVDAMSGQRQTSFQKCILHRCADRFGIIREQGRLLVGGLRLIKLQTSKIPIRLLKDLEPAEYMNNANVYDSRQFYNTNNAFDTRQQSDPGYGYNSSKSSVSSDPQLQATMTSLTRSMANTSMVEPRDSVTPLAGSTMKPKKMKIMKRTDKQKAASTMENSQQKKFLRKHSSEISEKEKAYAEARARIFNEESNNSSITDTENKNVADSTNSTNDTISPDISYQPKMSSYCEGTSAVAAPESNEGSPDETDRRQSGTSVHNQELNSSASGSAQIAENLQQATNHGSSNNLTQMETKAVYRNRAEEAADPDFRRHRNNPLIVPVQAQPMFGVSPSVVPAVPLNVQPVAASIPYVANTSWVPTSSSSFPLINNHHQQQQPIRQQSPVSPPYYATGGGARPLHQQQAYQYAHPHQQYAYQQQQYPLHANTFEVVGPAPSTAQGSVVAKFPYQHGTYKEYNSAKFKHNNSFGSSSASTKPRGGVTLKAAAPEFYPANSTSIMKVSPPSTVDNRGDELDKTSQSGQQF